MWLVSLSGIAADSHERFECTLVAIHGCRVVEMSPAVRPTSKARCCIFALVEDVEDVFSRKGNQQALRIALHVAFEAAQHRLHRSARLAPRVLKRDRALVDHDAEEVTSATRLMRALSLAQCRLNQHACRIDRSAECIVERVLFERIHQGPEREPRGLHPPRRRAPIKLKTFTRKALFLSIERQAIGVLVDEEFRDERRRCERARKERRCLQRSDQRRALLGSEFGRFHAIRRQRDGHTRVAAAHITQAIRRRRFHARSLAREHERLAFGVRDDDRLRRHRRARSEVALARGLRLRLGC